MPPFLRVVFLFSVAITTTTAYGQGSVLAEGDWYKLSIKTGGIYKLDYNFLKEIGLNPDNIDPHNIKIYGHGAGTLPQSNSLPRPDGLLEHRIMVKGESDGQFNNGDYILFYAQGPDSYAYNDNGKLIYERNIYSDYNYYFLTVANNSGLRIEKAPDLGSEFSKITTFNCFRYFEKESYNLLSSGREWFTEKFGSGSSYSQSFDFSFPALIPNSEIFITSAVMAQSFVPSKFSLLVNGVTLGDQPIAPVPNFREEDAYRYSVKGEESINRFTMNSNQISGSSLTVMFNYENNSIYGVGFLNYLQVEAVCQLRLNASHTIFRSIESTNNDFSTFEIAAASDKSMIWDISSPVAPLQQSFTLNGSTASFGTATTTLKDFIVFDVPEIAAPGFEGKVTNQNIRGISTPEMLIVAHPDFLTSARRLADFRATHDHLEAVVVTTDQIYNEFSSGKQDVTAIRDYVKYLYDKGNRLQYLLLFGRGSYDYKDVLPYNTNYVPVYQSRNSLHPLNTYASDDFYGFLEEHEGEWAEAEGGNHTLDIGIGRLPVTSVEMAEAVVNKIITYSTSPETLGSWRSEVVFVADDGDNNTHIGQSDQLAELIDTTFSNFNYNKLYLDAYSQKSTPNGERSPEYREALNQTIEQGALVVNFTGHGGEQVWMQEEVLNIFTIENWNNAYRLPLFVTATCEFARHDDPGRISAGELLVTNPEGGGIAIISTCRPVFSSSNFELNKAFYGEIFRTENGRYLRLGDVIRATKNNSIDEARDANRVGNRNFVLLGDPCLRLNYPSDKIVITAINDRSSVQDTLKAMAAVRISGEIRSSGGIKNEAFNGDLKVVVFDKESKLTTLGNESVPYAYAVRQNALFRGSATVKDGSFTFEFIVPKNISYEYGRGKISLYAMDEDSKEDAGGADREIVIGGTAPEAINDNSGPVIDLFLGDSTFTGGMVNNNTLLVAKITDESGINISKYGIGNNITATLDGKQKFMLNDFYVASTDTYQEGWISFPLNDLTEGRHEITVKAWDNLNNSSEGSIEFVVSSPGILSISNLKNYPNPFHHQTTVSFEHNRSGDDLEVNLQIISRHGDVVKDLDFIIEDSSAHIDLFEWDGTNDLGQKVSAGIYLFRVKVRSLMDGAKNQRYEKLILIN